MRNDTFERIQVGDLVVVIKPTPCCGNTNRLGLTFIVADLHLNSIDGGAACTHCGASNAGMLMALIGPLPQEFGISVPRLKRIPPLSELEGERTEENLKEPA